MTIKRILLAVALIAAAFSTPAHSQVTNCVVSASAPTYVAGQVSPCSVDLLGAIRTAASFPSTIAVTQSTSPWVVSGTVAATQSGTWNVGINAALPAGANTIGAVTQASGPWTTNQTQVGGVAVSVSTGNADTGTARVAVATNNPAVALWGQGATGAAAPANVVAQGVRSGANLVAQTQANASVAITGASATTAQLVALSASAVIHVTSFDFIAGGTANVTLVYGTGTNCGTGTTSLTGAYPLTAQAGIAKGSGTGPVLIVPAGNALCWTNSAAVQVSGSVSYTQFIP